MGIALVYLGEHYLVDVLAGVAVAAVAWRLARSPWGPFAARAPLAAVAGEGGLPRAA
jgi:membrane-associated phospholipid phosphatase